MQNDIKVISNQQEGLVSYFKKVWQYRHLLLNLTRRDLRVKYAQTSLGVVWIILQPITGMAIFTLILGNLINLLEFDIEIPYYLFAYSGYAVWLYFSYIVNAGGVSLKAEEALVKKVYFPRLIIPLSKALVGLVDFLVAMVVLLILMPFVGENPSLNFWAFPLYLLLASMAGLAIAIWLSALTIRYRDLHHFIPYIINFGIWLTPVFYPASIIPKEFYWLNYFNPMTGITEGFRWAIFNTPPPDPYFLASYFVMLILLLTGILYFRYIEKIVADYL
jgi:lipopolysaccharide transport system permease protein